MFSFKFQILKHVIIIKDCFGVRYLQLYVMQILDMEKWVQIEFDKITKRFVLIYFP